ncbi:MAG: metal-dependent hydrolase [Pseudomonadota bacterium]
MPTVLSHAAVPLALGLGLGGKVIPGRLLLAGVAASILPDLDVVAFKFHIAYADVFGHRGASHSLLFAVCVALLAVACVRYLKASRWSAFVFVAVSAASHGILDSLTNGGLGPALWWPFSSGRVFAPWQVIEVSPLTLQRIFSARGWAVLQSELFWIWLPALHVCAGLILLRHCAFNRSAG